MKIPTIIEQIRGRRDALAAQQAEAQRQYEKLEQTLVLLQRNLDAMHGGLQELDALLAEAENSPPRQQRRSRAALRGYVRKEQ